jgi:putative membrane protein
MGLMRIVVNAVALLVAGLLVPGITIAWGDEAEGIVVTLLVLALVFGVVNASIGRFARLLSIPLNILTLGLFSVLVNAALLLLVAWLAGLPGTDLIVIGGFPPDLTPQAVITAGAGAVVIGAVSTLLALLIPRA